MRGVRLRGITMAKRRDRRLWEIAMRHPWLIGPADAGLAFVDPESPLRHRLLLMLAVLEASPHHHHCFLAAPWPKTRLVALGLRATWAVLRVAAGAAWVRTHGVLWR